MKSVDNAAPAASDMALRQRLAWILSVGFLIAAAFILIAPQLNLVSQLGPQDAAKRFYDETLYSRIVVFGNYFQHGFIRRGLGGTLTYVVSGGPVFKLFFYLAFSVGFLLLPLSFLVFRLAKSLAAITSTYLAAVILVSPQTWLGWSHDLVRTDMLAGGFVAWSVLAVLSGYRWLGVSLILCGLLAHETAYIFGAPLLLAAFYEEHRSRSLSLQSTLNLLLSLFLGATAIFTLQLLLSPPPGAIAAGMLAAFPAPPNDDLTRIWRDIAIYMAVGNAHAISTAICHNFLLNPRFLITGVFCMAVLTAYAFILPLWRRPLIVALTMWLPVLFMLIIANDTGRWLKLGVLNAWLITTFLTLRSADGVKLSAHSQILGALSLSVMHMMGHTPYSDVSQATRVLTTWLGFTYDITLEQWLNTCDPEWRSIVYGS